MTQDFYTPKQLEVLSCFVNEKPYTIVCSGAKRAGKTFVLTHTYLMHIQSFEGMGLNFIIAGASSAAIRRNVLGDIEALTGLNIKLDKNNSFQLFGNTITCFKGSSSDDWKTVRGFTAAGAFLNEGTALHDKFVKECFSRCSYEGAHVFIDTNPENPMHTIKKDYIDKSGQKLEDGTLNIIAFNFTLFDNNKLSKRYVDSIVKSTPSGVFTERDIYGNWVSAEGVVYKDFDKDRHLIDNIPEDEEIEKYVGGIDFGFEHYGTIVVLAKTYSGKYYLVREYAEKRRYVDTYWAMIVESLSNEYPGIIFYADHARPDYIDLLRSKGLYVVNAKKSVFTGINAVGSLLVQDKLFFIKSQFKIGLEEMFLYMWSPVHKNGKEEVLKINDDVLNFRVHRKKIA